VVGWQLAAARPADIEALLALEKRCFGLPWGRLSLEAELDAAGAGNRLAWDPAPAGAGRLIGYIFFRFIADEVHIFRMAVDPAARRQGLGSLLLDECLRCGRAAGRSAALLETRRSNAEALALYRKFGFALLATRPGYYTDTREDALILKLDLTKEDL
jgi:ribosomal-protein-alanine N-acetyltransferase